MILSKRSEKICRRIAMRDGSPESSVTLNRRSFSARPTLGGPHGEGAGAGEGEGEGEGGGLEVQCAGAELEADLGGGPGS